MSMFHELMMRKKEEIMYATIKGTLTENDGVFSGFSASNYLQLQNDIDTSKDWEFVVKFDNTTSKYHSVILGSNSTANSIKIEISYGTRFFIFLSSNGTSWNIANGAYGLTNAMSLGNTYYMKLTYSTTSGYKLYLSTDGKEWVSQYTNGTTNPLYMTNAKFILGASLFDNNSLGGGIDLNRSYVKSQSTKYKLQAVVGYTIVGSPTITDGVASGFSASDYLTFPTIMSAYSSDDINRVEMGIKIKTGNSVGLSGLIVNSNYYYNGLLLDSNKKPSFYFNLGGFDNAVSDVVLQPNTEYTIIGILNKKTNSIKISVNGIVNTNIANYFTFSNNQATGIGYGYRTGAFEGSIDLKSTYIKVNNKLYFNGQQA